jgi:transcriptional regulator with XRE-family HTH domain
MQDGTPPLENEETSLTSGALGEAVRSLREGQGLSVRTLAKRAGFSPSFISQVEHGLASPSIASMEKIARELGVSLSRFFAGEVVSADRPVIVRAGEGEELASAWSQARVRSLSPSWAGRQLSPMTLTVEPGGRSGGTPSSHQGEAFAYVLEGSGVLRLVDEVVRLGAGDAVHLPPGTEHGWENPGNAPVTLLLVTSGE